MQAELPAGLDTGRLISILQKCKRKKDLHHARCVLAYLRDHFLESHPILGNCLVSTLVECGSLRDAQRVFDILCHRNERSWTSLISGYVNHGEFQYAVHLYHKMQGEKCSQPSTYTYVVMLNACSRRDDAETGKRLHAAIIQRGMEMELHVANALVDMYGKCGALAEADQVFNGLPARDAVSWTALIAGYAEHGLGDKVLNCYKQMQLGRMYTDAFTFVCCLKACGSIGALHSGQSLHCELSKMGFERELIVGNSLINMYSKCGSLAEAHRVFDKQPLRDAVSWKALVAAHAEHGLSEEVLICFKRIQLEGVFVDTSTFILCLKACGTEGDLETGHSIHSEITTRGLEKELYMGSTMVDMYGKCYSLAEAVQVFDGLPVRNAVSWTALIAGYTEQGLAEEALNCLTQMQAEGVSADAVMFALCLKACGTIGVLEAGREIHDEIRKTGLERDPLVGNMLVDMYAKCGSVAEGQEVFNQLLVRDVVSWSTMIKAYGENYAGDMAVKCFEEMRQQGVEPNTITFTCLLTACTHANLVSEGQKYFKMMIEEYGIEPLSEHYACMVDLLARSGHIYEAEKFLVAMQCPPSCVTLMNLLNACKIYGKVKLGHTVFQQLVEVNQENAASYSLMTDIYASAGRLTDANRIDEMRKGTGAKKKPASAITEVGRKVNKFAVGVTQTQDISEMLGVLSSYVKHRGYVPNTDLVSRHEEEVTPC